MPTLYKIALLLFFLACCSAVMAQKKHSIVGTAVDTTGAPLAGALVKLLSPSDTLVTAADGEGVFHFETASGSFQIEVTLIGFEGIRRRYTIAAGVLLSKLDPIRLKVSPTQLQGVVVVGKVNPIVIKEDTVEYKASAYKVRPGSPVEELIKKLPGVSVDANGNITAQGQQITKIRVNGKDFFGGDVQTATKNLPADIIESLQVIDDYGDQANITGIKMGDPDKILNLQIRKDRNKGFFMQGLLGLGADREKTRYVGTFSGFYFHDTRQISVIGSLNNTNLTSFSFGSTGSNGQNQSGISTTRSVGINYRDQWGKKMSVYGSYSFSDATTLLDRLTQRTSIFLDTSIYTGSNSTQKQGSVGHRFTFNMEYKPDTANYLKITPGFTYNKNSSLTTGSFINEAIVGSDSTKTTRGTTYDHSNSSTPSGSLAVLYNHRFRKVGRNFNINANLSFSNNNAPETVDNLNEVYNEKGDSINTIRQYQFLRNKNRSNNESASLSWTEPLGKINLLEFNYNLSHSSTVNDHDTYAIDPQTGAHTPIDSLTNDYKYQFTSNRVGLNFRGITKLYNYVIGLAAQPSLLSGHSLTTGIQTRRSEFNVFPVARFVYRFSKGHEFTFRYSGRSVQPSFNQLQPVTNRSNPLNPVQGNPDLKPSFVNSVNLRYNQFDFKESTALFANLSFTQTQNQVVNNQVRKGADTIYNSFRNASGAITASGYFNYSQPFAGRKFTASVSGNASYSNNISFIDDQKNTGRNWMLSPTLKLRADLDTLMDTEISATYTNNSTTYSLPGSRDVNSNTWQFGLNGRNYFFRDWILGYDLRKSLNNGYGSGINANPAILNLYIERQFLKNNMASLRIAGYDLFNQNTGVSQSVSGNSISNSRISRLARYFMLSYSMKFQNFAGKVPDQGRGHGGRNGRGGRSGGGFGGGGFGDGRGRINMD